MVLAIMATFAWGRSAHGDQDPGVMVVMSRDEGPYQAVIGGLRESLESGTRRVPIEVHSFQRDAKEARAAVAAARRYGKAPIVTVGSVATRAALDTDGSAPVIACMIVNDKDLKGKSNATGVVLEFPLETQLEWMKRFVPEGRSIGVLFNPAENSDRIADATRVAKRQGLHLEAREVDRPQALPTALNSLARHTDLLWGVTDQVVLSRQTAEAILLFSFRNRIPFAGLSTSWVKAGALYALERDYTDLGAQCGEMALRVRRGRRVSSMPPETPRRIVYALNLRTAARMKLSLPKELVDGAEQVFE